MARDERLKKVQGAGADFLETARARAEEFLRELSRAGGDTQGRAQGALDELMEGGRKGTGQLVSVIRKEITNQLSMLGLATKDDLADLERRLSGRAAATKAAGAATKTTGAATKTTGAAAKTTARKTTGGTGTTGAAKTSGAASTTGAASTAKSSARKAPAARKSAATKKAAG